MDIVAQFRAFMQLERKRKESSLSVGELRQWSSLKDRLNQHLQPGLSPENAAALKGLRKVGMDQLPAVMSLTKSSCALIVATLPPSPGRDLLVSKIASAYRDHLGAVLMELTAEEAKRGQKDAKPAYVSPPGVVRS